MASARTQSAGATGKSPKKSALKKTAAKKAKAPKPEAPDEGALDDLFGALREVAENHAGNLIVKHDIPGSYYVVSPRPYDGQELFVFGVRLGKKNVSYYLFPVYMFPDMLQGLTPELMKRMRGKACFKFKYADEALFRELGGLTKRGVEVFAKNDLI